MILVGTVAGRRRSKMVLNDGKTRYRITFHVQHTRGVTACDMFSEEPAPSGLPLVGQIVSLPVEVRVFPTKAGPRFSLGVEGSRAGESF